ncbi:uncharacterized protein PV06_11744 [Exophiala oligosperma]|uniref:GRF-like zinc ribbon domain-containing protein n=1 Tax=Exophiala oligosperma TaxID=215243 RepID=A0A0D2BEN3_9EURO|nr:uncharacterized protein PV06_11744 [Exophiala oligosperma]KIW35947.1 hypothetical protein PV06_11744 [Exophiala oligosperma]
MMEALDQALGAWLSPPPAVAPDCIKCGKPTVWDVTKTSNRKGNAGRPYYICKPRRKFHCFADTRGNDPRNPACFCGVSSKTQVSGADKKTVRGVHYVCRRGKCDYYRLCLDDQNQQISLPKHSWTLSLGLVSFEM